MPSEFSSKGVTESAAQVWGVEGKMWSAATCRRFCAGTTCRPGSTASSGASLTTRVAISRNAARCEPLCAALPERQVAQAMKAATSLRTPKTERQFQSHPLVQRRVDRALSFP